MKLIRHESAYNPTIKAKLKQMVQDLDKKKMKKKLLSFLNQKQNLLKDHM